LAADTRIKDAAAGRRGRRVGEGRGPGRFGTDRPRSATLSSPTDQLNRAIVRLLQEDGRLPFKTIARKLGVSEGTVRNRVGWMKCAGMLRIVAVADPTAINYRADAMLGVKVAPSSTPAKVAERLSVHPQVVYILWVSGRFDLLVEVVCESDEDFLDFLSKHCFDQDDIASLEVMTGLAMYKNQFLLKQDYP
jgi:Lrp/AsnC family transcriptional regulator, regulator for asnA, asnC and gidA